jgi:thiamine pyrophosphokinase
LKKDRVCIIANGEFPTKDYLVEQIKDCKYIVCCDGAIEALDNHNITPNIIIGDLDSISIELKEKYQSRIKQISCQETNDLTKAFNHCLEKSFTEIEIYAATGKREDHCLANISLLYDYNSKANVSMYTDYGKFICLTKSSSIECKQKQSISIFAEYTDNEISSKNLKYPLNQLMLKQMWQGSLNTCISDNFTLEFTKGKVLVYLAN